MLMRAQVEAEFELAHDRVIVSRASLYQLLNSLSGIAANATACGACAMGASIADEALERFAHATGVTREMAYRWRRGEGA